MLTVLNKRRVFAADFQKDRPNLFKLDKNTIQFPDPLQTFCFLWSSFQTAPEEYDKEALFLIRHENEAFQKRSLNRRNLKTPALRFRVDGKHFENGAFFENDDVTIITWFLCPSFSQTKIQILRRSVEGNYFDAFSEGKVSVFKFLRRCVYRAWVLQVTKTINLMDSIVHLNKLTCVEFKEIQIQMYFFHFVWLLCLLKLESVSVSV